jgi:hypothetical protein
MAAAGKPVDKGSVNEFTTDVDNPPCFRKNDTPFPPEFKEVIRKEFPELQPAVISGRTLEQVFDKVVEAADSMTRWEVTHQEDAEGCVEGTYTTMMIRRKEDFTIRIARGASEGEVVVDMRTRPRNGGQLDGNMRITEFMTELQEVLKG